MNSLISYMEEARWFDGDVYVVWLHGCTDGWPRAIFNSLEDADLWLNHVYLNPEGYTIEHVRFAQLCRAVAERPHLV